MPRCSTCIRCTGSTSPTSRSFTCATKRPRFELELTLNKGRTEPYTHGTGYGHVAVVVPDVATRHAELVGAGYEPTPVKEFKSADTLLARFCFIQDPDGYKIEIIERHDHYV